MNIRIRIAASALLTATALSSEAFADPQNNHQAGEKDKYVMVTGSMIPRKVKVKSIGTTTTSPLRVYKRREIDQTGRFTTEGVLAQDPSVRVTSGGLPGDH